MEAEERIQAVSQFLLQSPPGEINDVLNGTVNLLSKIQIALSTLTQSTRPRPRFQMYACSSGTTRASKWAFCRRCNSTTSSNSRLQRFREQVTMCVVISLRCGPYSPDFGPLRPQSIVSARALVPGEQDRFLDPRSNKSFLFDHLSLVRPVQLDCFFRPQLGATP